VISNQLCPQAVVPVSGAPRTVAGESVTTDQNACQMVPLDRSAYDVSFTAAEWAELQSAFPTGVCDYAEPGLGQQNAVPWLTYQNAKGQVIYGGAPMGPAPVSRAFDAGACPSRSVEARRRRPSHAAP
jgi:hypothetical protein